MLGRSDLLGAIVIAGALAPGVGQAAPVRVAGEAVEFAMDMTAPQPEAPMVGGQADLRAKLQSLQTNLQVNVQSGVDRPDDGQFWRPSFAGLRTGGSWNSGRVGLGAVWEPSPKAKLEFSANNQIRLQLDPVVSLTSDPTQGYLRSTQSVARVAATLAPFAPFNLQVGGQTLGQSERRSTVSSAGLVGSDLLRTQARQVFSNLQWRLLPSVHLEGGGQIETIAVDWQGASARRGAYTFFEPRFAGTLTPWTGASWRIGVERAVSPIRTDQFLSFAQATDRTTSARFGPDQEWRYQASLQQRLAGGIDLKATLTRARLERVTDLGPVGTGQAPIEIGSGERQQIEAAIAAPVRLFGLPVLAVKANGVWRVSQVEDAFTGAGRRLSGETPYAVELLVSPQAAGEVVRWGLRAHASGATNSYQMSQVTTYSATAGLGGFVTYAPGPLTIQLRLDNVLGGGRDERNVYFAGPRLLNTIDRISDGHSTDRAVRILLGRRL
jgi:hypothetical protein